MLARHHLHCSTAQNVGFFIRQQKRFEVTKIISLKALSRTGEAIALKSTNLKRIKCLPHFE
jgi:hypothetical protein